jgi:uncharacterized protein involved in type VI secretion and phage assembly
VHGRENGIVVGLVKSLDDREKIARVQVTYPHLGGQQDEVLSDWARLVTPMGGPNRGLFLRPEPGDEVLIAFEHGDPRRPYVLGAMWSKTDAPPRDDGKTTENNWRFIRSRAGSLLVFDDTKGAEKIQIVDKDGARKIVIDTQGQKIQVTCDQGDVEVSAGKGTVRVNALNVEIKASGSMTLEAQGSLSIKGATVSINE